MTSNDNPNPYPKPKYWPAVFSISLTMFVVVSSELLPISLLSSIAADLNVSMGVAGQSISVTAIVAAVASPTILLGAGLFDRRKLVIGLTAIVFVSSLIAAVSHTYWMLLVARALLGVSLGGLWGMVTSLALRLVPTASVPRAISIVFFGVTAAGVLAPSVGLYLTQVWGWRGTFGAIAATGLVALLGMIFTLPKLPAAQPSNLAAFRITATNPPVMLGLLTVLLMLGGHFAGFTYVRPLLQQIAHFDDDWIAFALFAFGLAGMAGSALGGVLGQYSAAGGAALSALLVAIAVVALAVLGNESSIAFGSIILWGLAFAIFPVCISTWNAQAAPEFAESAGSLMATSFQIAIALGAALGGSLYEGFGAAGLLSFTSLAVLGGAFAMLVFGMPLERSRKSI